MATEATYKHLERRPDKRSQELFVRGAGIRASTIWHDRYVSRLSPSEIAKDRDIPIEAIYEALPSARKTGRRSATKRTWSDNAWRRGGSLGRSA